MIYQEAMDGRFGARSVTRSIDLTRSTVLTFLPRSGMIVVDLLLGKGSGEGSAGTLAAWSGRESQLALTGDTWTGRCLDS